MNPWSLLQYLLFLVIVIASVKPVGLYLVRVFAGQATWLDFALRPIERWLYRLAAIRPQEEMTWKQYAGAFLLFSLLGTLLLYVILRTQALFPTSDPSFTPQNLAPDLALNTAVSFATTTTWQAYAGETTMAYWTQLVGLAAQNFLAGAAGLAVGMAFIRGFARQRCATIGNFWVDLTRGILWVLLPVSLLGGLFLVWQGVPANFNAYQQCALLQPITLADGTRITTQVLPQGPVAALEFIKNLGTNGGGFFNVNGAHPYANPTPLSNVVGMLAICVLPAALTYVFGRMTNCQMHGWLLLGVMTILFVAGLAVCDWAEQNGNPRFHVLGVDQTATAMQAGGNMEGKETRFGIAGSVLTAVASSNGATGSYNAMHDSFMPLGGAVPLVNMLLGEIVFGGLGTGIYSMVMIVMIALFVGSLMVGRAPEYLGHPIGAAEIKLIALYTVIGPMAVLLLVALAVVTAAGIGSLYVPGFPFATIFNPGPHGFSEVVFAYASAVANNGQNFAGLGANNPFYNITLALAMIVGRFGLAIPALALAGHAAVQQRRPTTKGTLPVDTPLFGLMTLGTIVIVGALNYIPTLALGPLVEQLEIGLL